MKPTPCILVLMLALLVAACAPKTIEVPEKPTAAPGEAEKALFSKAEGFYVAGDLKNALAAYQELVAAYPRGPHAADALMRIGAIYRFGGNLEAALDAYRRVVSEYPASDRGADAQVEIISVYFQQEAYDQVISQAQRVLEHPVTSENVYRAYTILGDAYQATGRMEEAVRAYASAARFADGPRQEELQQRLETAVDKLDMEQVVTLLGYLDDPLTRGYLLFRLGAQYFQAERYQEALTTLSELIERYPDHKMAPEAQALLGRIGQVSGETRFIVGCLLPLSGPSAVFGEQALDGAEFALNRRGSAGEAAPIEILVKDTASDPRKAEEAVRELAEKNVAVIIGPIFTAPAAAAEAQRLRIPIVTISQKEDIAQTGDYVFRNFFTPRMQIQALVAYAVAELNLSRFAILYPDEKYGQTFMNLFWDEVISSGARVVGVESYKSTHTDFADPIKKLAGTEHMPPAQAGKADGGRSLPVLDFEALFIPDSPRHAGLVIPQLAYNDVIGIQLMGTNLWHSDVLLEMARPYVQGAIMPDIFFAGSANPLVESFVAGFSKTYEREPGFIEAILYDTAMMVFQALDEARIGFRPAVRNRLASLKDFAGVTGLTSFGEDGEVRKSLYLLKIEGNKFVEIPR